MQEVTANEARKKEQAEKGFDGLTYFVYRTLLDAQIDDAEEVSRKIKQVSLHRPHRNSGGRKKIRSQIGILDKLAWSSASALG